MRNTGEIFQFDASRADQSAMSGDMNVVAQRDFAAGRKEAKRIDSHMIADAQRFRIYYDRRRVNVNVFACASYAEGFQFRPRQKLAVVRLHEFQALSTFCKQRRTMVMMCDISSSVMSEKIGSAIVRSASDRASGHAAIFVVPGQSSKLG